MGGGGEGDLKKGPWTREEDQKLIAYIQEHGYGSWRTLPTAAGLQRCGKSCRLRWTNYLRPDIKRGKFSSHEEKTIIRLHALLGNRWSAIAAHLPKRTDNEIKNYWNTRLKKRLTRMGIDPATHKPKPGSTRPSSSLTHMAQWEAARLEAEARLTRQSNLFRINKPPLFRRQPPPNPIHPTCSFFRSPRATLDSPTSTLNFSCNGPTLVNTNDAVPMNDYACASVGQLDFDCYTYTDVPLQLQDDITRENVDVYPSELAGIPVDQLADNPQLLEDDKSYWNYLLNLVSSPMIIDSSTSFASLP